MRESKYENKTFLGLMNILLDQFIKEYEKNLTHHADDNFSASFAQSRIGFSIDIDHILWDDNDLRKTITKKFINEDVFKDYYNKDTNNSLPRVSDNKSLKNETADQYDIPESPEEAIVGILLAAIDKTILTEGEINKKLYLQISNPLTQILKNILAAKR